MKNIVFSFNMVLVLQDCCHLTCQPRARGPRAESPRPERNGSPTRQTLKHITYDYETSWINETKMSSSSSAGAKQCPRSRSNGTSLRPRINPYFSLVSTKQRVIISIVTTHVLHFVKFSLLVLSLKFWLLFSPHFLLCITSCWCKSDQILCSWVQILCSWLVHMS